VQERIDKIEEELDLVRRHRTTQRVGRQRSKWPLASIVGYTNAGKSTLLNRLTGAGVFAEDKLFATLDPTTRRLRLPTNQNVLLTDTVGFIRKLPHGLVEAFKATLEEVAQADMLLHVVDLSHPGVDDHIKAVNSVRQEIGACGKPTLMVFNKIDKIAGQGKGVVDKYKLQFPGAAFVSAQTGAGTEELLAELGGALRPERELVELAVPHEAASVVARLHEVGEVVKRRYDGEVARFTARIPPHFHGEFARFMTDRSS
jgi:GTP-binding protein HflX